MQIVTVEQLAKGGISIGQSSTITIKNRQFHIGPTFSLKMRDAAISFCKQEESQGIKCLLVENATALTVWKHTVDLTEKIVAEIPDPKFAAEFRSKFPD